MQRAMAMFPHDAAKRIVLVTDGNQNIGDALEEARAIADAGVSIDVMPVPLDRRSDVSVEKIALPPDIRRNQPFEAARRGRTIRRPTRPATAKPVKGRIRIVRKAGEREETLVDEPHRDQAGQDACSRFARKSTSPISTRTKRSFVPDDPASDALTQNNLATAFTHVHGKGQVLLIENWETPGEFDYLVERLRNEGLGSCRAAEQSAVHVAAGAAAVRHGDPGRRAAHQRRRRGQREQLFATSRSRCWSATRRSSAAG